MSEPPRQFFTGNTLEQAVIAAANHHQVDPDEIAYERVERRYGFLRGRRRVVIKVDPEHPTRRRSEAPSEAPHTESVGEGRPASGQRRETQKDFDLHEAPTRPDAARPDAGREEERRRRRGRPPREERPEREAPSRPSPRRPTRRDLLLAEGEVAAAAQEGLQRLAVLAGLDIEATVYQGEDRLEIEVAGRDQDEVVKEEGEVLLALQHLLPRLMYSTLGEMMPCHVDSEGFRQQRAEYLEQMARRAAEEVRERGRPKTLRSLNPADRRTVHLALQDDEDVVTESAGEGFFKRITVRRR